MPEISRFYGILIKMYFTKAEHNPPHFHALYNDKMAEIDIKTLEVIAGDLPPKALSIVKEWAQKHQADLMRIWESQVFTPIPPLE